MEVKLAFLADCANISKDGKLNLLGISNTINAPSIPWVCPKLQLALQFEVGKADWDTEKGIEVKIYDEVGSELSELRGNIRLARPEGSQKYQFYSIMSINNLKFSAEGDYTFSVRLDGEIKSEIPLRVNHAPPNVARR